jgi:hypothetical protein
MIKTSGFFRRSGLISNLVKKTSFNASIKRFQLGEIPEVLKYDRPYGFLDFLKDILDKILLRNRSFT